jgi:hypothetical protein
MEARRALAGRPAARNLRPAFELRAAIAGRLLLARTLQPRIDEIRSDVGDLGEVVAVGEHHRHPGRPRHRDEFGIAEAFVPRLDRVTEANAVLSGRQKIE